MNTLPPTVPNVHEPHSLKAEPVERPEASPGTVNDPHGTVDLPATPSVESAPVWPEVPGFALEEELGRGGMGVVYRARQLPLNRLVALKMILAGDHARAEAKVRFLAEAEAIAKVQHPGIVQVYEFGTHQGHPYFALEYVSGGSLDRALRDGPMPPKEAAQLVATLADAVQAAHAQGIVHRDLKPANVLLAIHGNDNSPPLQGGAGGVWSQPKITDFGLAKQIDAGPGLTATGAVMGTPSYMAPEQAAGNLAQIGPATDVYALGAILYECLTGRPPFRGAAVLDTLDMVLRQEPVAVRQLQPKAPKDLETICHKCLQKEPAKRYATAAALADDLRNYLDGKPITARPVGRMERTVKWCRRYPAGAALIVVSTMAAIVASILATWAVSAGAHARHESDEKGKALESAQQRLGEVQKSNALIQSIFHGVDPYSIEKGGATVEDQLRKQVELTADQLDGEAIGDPLTVAALQHTLGSTLLSLHSLRKAEALLTKAMATRHALLGPNHADTIWTATKLALVFHHDGRYDEAIALLEKNLQRARTALGVNQSITLSILDNLGSTYLHTGKISKALPLLEESLQQRKVILGLQHTETLIGMHSLGVAYRAAGRLREAIPLHQKERSILLEIDGPDHPRSLSATHALAAAYVEIGRPQDALTLLTEARRRSTDTLGPDHPTTLRIMSEMARAHHVAGQLKEATELYAQVLPLCQRRFGPDHPETYTVMNNLAAMYYYASRLEEAVPLYEHLMSCYAKKLGLDHPAALAVMGNLAAVYHVLGHSAKAISLTEQVLTIQKAKLGPDHPDSLATLNNLAVMRSAAGQYDRAVSLFEQAVTKRKAKLGPAHPDTLTTMLSLASNHRKAGQPDRALVLLEPTLTLMKKNSGPDHRDTLSCLNELAATYLALKQPAKAESLLRESLNLREKKESDVWTTFNTKFQLGAALLDQKKYAEAEPLLVQGYQGMKQREGKIPKPHKYHFTEARARLVQFYEATGKTEEAAKWRKDLEEQKAASTPGKQ